MWWRLTFAACALVGINLVVTKMGWVRETIFLPGAVAAGEWWRVVTHPFIHVSWYHLLLDGAAFLILYAGLSGYDCAARFFFCSSAAIGSVVAALLFAPALPYTGLCGLSGVAHGLMAVSGVDMLGHEDRTTRRMGTLALVLVVGKSVIEAVTGQVVFVALHSGRMGAPVAVCHLGGVVGGLAAYGLVQRHAVRVARRMPA